MAFTRSTGLRNKLLGITLNKVVNPDFNVDTTGWSVTNVDATIESSGGINNGTCCKIAASGTNPGNLFQTFTVKKGRTYKIDAYIKSGDAPISLQVGTTTVKDLYYDSGQYSGTTDYKHCVFTFESVDTNCEINFILHSTASAQYAFVDSVHIYDMASSIKEIFNNSVIKIYQGSKPSTADEAISGQTLLVTITNGSQANVGLTFGEASEGKISKTPTEVWSGVAVNAGTAQWFRLSTFNDTGGASDVEERIDGSIGTSGAELNMSNTYISQNAVQTISIFDISIAS